MYTALLYPNLAYIIAILAYLFDYPLVGLIATLIGMVLTFRLIRELRS